MRKMIKRSFSIFMVFTFLLGIISTKAEAETSTWDWFFDSKIKFDTDDTAEAAASVGRLYFAVNEDETTVSVVGSYIIDKNGNIDDTQCDSKVIIPEKVTYNNVTYAVTRTEGTFFNKKVESVTFPDSLIEIGTDTLVGTNVKEINITKNVAKIDEFAINYNQYLTTLTVCKDNAIFSSISNVVYTNGGKSLVLAANLGKKITVRNGVEKILGNAFSNCAYTKGPNSFVSILNELTLPASITCLEEYSVRNDVLLITFKGKLPKVLCDITGEDGPILVVPTAYVSAYKKISYNCNKIDEKKVTSTLSTKTAKDNKKRNDSFISKIDWSIAKDKIYYKTSTKQWNTLKAHYQKVASAYTDEEDKIKAVLVDILNTSYINSKYYDAFGVPSNYSSKHPEVKTLPWTYENLQEGTFRSMAVELGVAAIRSIGSEAVKVYPIENGESSSEHDKILVRLKNKKEILINLTKEMGEFNGDVKIDTSNGLPTLKYYDLNRNIFDYSSKMFTVTYYNKEESLLMKK